MSTLVAVAYNDQFRAQEVRTSLLRLQKGHLIDLEDAVVARKGEDGEIKLEQLHNLTSAGAIGGGFWGLLIGTLLMAPIFGLAAGASTGAISGALTDIGINDDFMREVAAKLEPKTSALFVLVRSASPDRVLEELRGTGGQIVRTSLSHEDEAKLQAALDAEHPER
ncbi:MAG: DUF1269 domain-containing protein [Myxococcales bacterium FL481]|nr:MAG: DUF1269 domain-containing protein [Myxococcales bacterium FL481]